MLLLNLRKVNTFAGENEEQVCYLKDDYFFSLNHLKNRATPNSFGANASKAEFFSPLLLPTKKKTSFVQMHE
jgi:hypothetical protein